MNFEVKSLGASLWGVLVKIKLALPSDVYSSLSSSNVGLYIIVSIFPSYNICCGGMSSSFTRKAACAAVVISLFALRSCNAKCKREKNEREEMKNNAKVSRHKLLKPGDGKRNATAKVIN